MRSGRMGSDGLDVVALEAAIVVVRPTFLRETGTAENESPTEGGGVVVVGDGRRTSGEGRMEFGASYVKIGDYNGMKIPRRGHV